MSEQNPFDSLPQVQGSMGGPVVNFVRLLLQGLRKVPGEAAATSAPLQEELTSQALSGPFRGLVGAPMRGLGGGGIPSPEEVAELKALRPNVGPSPTSPEAEGVDQSNVALLSEAQSQRTGQGVDEAMRELEFSARDTGQPSPEALARLEEAVTKRNGPEHAQRLMERVRAKFQAPEVAPEPQGSVIDHLRQMAEGNLDQMLDADAARGLGLEGGFPENVVPPSRLDRARTNKRQGEQKQRTQQLMDEGERSVTDESINLANAAERRVGAGQQLLSRLQGPSAEPGRVKEAALRQRAEMEGISFGKPGPNRIVLDNDSVAETITGLGKKGEQEPLGHMFTNPSTGAVRLSVLSQGKGGRQLVQIGFPGREQALRWVAANMGQSRRATMLGADRLQAFQKAQEAAMGKPVGQILLD